MASMVARFFTVNESNFAFNLKYLFLVGLWPEDDLTHCQKLLYKVYTLVLHALTICFFIITGIGTYDNKNELPVFLANFDKIFCAYNFFLKTVVFIFKRDEIKTLIEEINNSGDVVPEERNKLMSKVVFIIMTSSLLVVGSFSAFAIFEKKKLVDTWMPFDPFENRVNLSLSVQIIAIFFIIILFRAFAMQAIVCSLIMYLCDQLIDLQMRIKDLKYTEVTGMKMRKIFKDIVKKHVRLMRYSKTMESIFKEYFLIQHLAITIELCLNAIMVTIVTDITLIVTFVAYLSLALLNAYIYSYLGNELMIQSQGIALAGYQAPWTTWPADMQKDLLILIRVAQKPLALSAGRISLLSIQTFSQALYNGYSIFAVLNDMVD